MATVVVWRDNVTNGPCSLFLLLHKLKVQPRIFGRLDATLEPSLLFFIAQNLHLHFEMLICGGRDPEIATFLIALHSVRSTEVWAVKRKFQWARDIICNTSSEQNLCGDQEDLV